ncbi:MAG: ABC transporter ATP-binding protein [Clostridiales bacterium]|nr:ABC transporter ATP-binding protein [Clostridiales bacterium]
MSNMEDNKIMLDIQDVSMRFMMTNDKVTSIKEMMTQMVKGKIHFKEFWALRNVSFQVKKGEVVGIIGRNGAGKSTILKIISGIMKPTGGNVVRNGNIVPMLELGSGFDMDLTGKENIFLNGAILGYSKSFLMEKYEEILAFSELGEFIHMPIRNYSSGMLMRLAFSIATVVNPEILIVDEILAVGDENFQRKSRARMMELMSGGTTVLFVSHDLGQIRQMCNRVVWLDNGTTRMVGDTKDVCDAYKL